MWSWKVGLNTIWPRWLLPWGESLWKKVGWTCDTFASPGADRVAEIVPGQKQTEKTPQLLLSSASNGAVNKYNELIARYGWFFWHAGRIKPPGWPITALTDWCTVGLRLTIIHQFGQFTTHAINLWQYLRGKLWFMPPRHCFPRPQRHADVKACKYMWDRDINTQ